ncbi:uncharacterized protein C8Q71DRAFT_791721 [Rhodofomes roseus]|uniref:DUF6533 domain-containing protein n=1 Tax=Rhodofomes roseus TaxID=34475 RepID=A0ABQ8JY37_9APHY|nr:uncharacterized protein C8Q71DRAFT_791721 [Rhodofomes roseus]KAH9829096.1 hypothetical protein C8Q71DRAFT_791721 [Rhodofomes roseus]
MSDSITAAVTFVIEEQYLQNCCNIAAFAMYLFDVAITLGDQIDHIWRRSFSGVTALFITLHLSTLSVYVLYIVQVPLVECQPAYITNMAYALASSVQVLTVAAVAALRIYAINGHDGRLPTLVFSLSVVSFASTLYYCVVLTTEFLPPPINACVVYPSQLGIYSKFSIIGNACFIVAELLVLLSTWRHTYGLKKLARENNQEVSLTYLLLRDGTVYFGLMFFLEIFASVGQYVTALAGAPGFVFALEAILLSRFILNLRRVALQLMIPHGRQLGAASFSAFSSRLSFSELQFDSRVLGTLGGSLALGSSYDGETGIGNDVLAEGDPEYLEEMAAHDERYELTN